MIGRRVYRGPRVTRVLGWMLVPGFFVGVVTATGSPGNPGEGGTIGAILGVAVATAVTLFSLLLGAILATNSLTVTPAGLISRNNLRRRLIGWPEIESFTVGPGQGRMKYPTLIACLNDGSKVITNVTSFTARHPSPVARELTALHAGAAASAVTSQGTTAGEPD